MRACALRVFHSPRRDARSSSDPTSERRQCHSHVTNYLYVSISQRPHYDHIESIICTFPKPDACTCARVHARTHADAASRAVPSVIYNAWALFAEGTIDMVNIAASEMPGLFRFSGLSLPERNFGISFEILFLVRGSARDNRAALSRVS